MKEIEGHVKLARKGTVASKPWVNEKDERKAAKPCSQCGVWTVMGTERNVPAHARERWTGKQYVRFCGPECETKGGF